MDFTTVFRSTDVGSGIGSSFGSIPFNAASPAGELSEVRFSAQNSRVGMKIDANPGGDLKVRGYLETDFLGNAAGNIEIGSHAYTLRMRLYWVDVHKGKIEVLAGQSWSMMTPNRVGISPMPGDIFYSQNMDTNYQVGLVWLRTPSFRLIFHPTDNVAWGFALEDPEQYTGGLVTFPTGFSTAQVDDSGGNSKTPNKGPDIISKLAFDTHPNGGGRNLHVEVAGVYRAFRLNTVGLGNVTTSGGGGSINANLELAKGFHLIANTFWSDGGGRYIFQLGPDFTVNVNGAGNFVPSPIHAGSGIVGIEATVKKSLLYAYYGGAYFGRDFHSHHRNRRHDDVYGLRLSRLIQQPKSHHTGADDRPHPDVLEESELRRFEAHYPDFLSIAESLGRRGYRCHRQQSRWSSERALGHGLRRLAL